MLEMWNLKNKFQILVKINGSKASVVKMCTIDLYIKPHLEQHVIRGAM